MSRVKTIKSLARCVATQLDAKDRNCYLAPRYQIDGKFYCGRHAGRVALEIMLSEADAEARRLPVLSHAGYVALEKFVQSVREMEP